MELEEYNKMSLEARLLHCEDLLLRCAHVLESHDLWEAIGPIQDIVLGDTDMSIPKALTSVGVSYQRLMSYIDEIEDFRSENLDLYKHV